MKVLIIKMSSMGDVIHTLPALTDASHANPELRFDWVVERAFADIPALHPAVDRVLPIEFRRWRKAPFRYRHELLAFRADMRQREYDLVIDAQGLIKSALVTRQARGPRAGFDRQSAREGLASLAIDRQINIPQHQHAIARLRQLFAAALGYTFQKDDAVDYGLTVDGGSRDNTILLLHGTTWKTKHWPETFWEELASLVAADGFRPVVPAGNETERRRAEKIAASGSGEILDRVPLAELAKRFARSRGAVAVDTGLGHLAASLDVPMASLFGPTDPGLTGPIGRGSITLQDLHLPCMPCRRRVCQFDRQGDVWPPCFAPLTPGRVWQSLKEQMR